MFTSYPQYSCWGSTEGLLIFGSTLAGGMAAWWPQGWDSIWHYCATMAPVNEALDKPFLRIRVVLVVSGLVIWPQGFHAKGHGSVPCGSSLLGLFSSPHPWVCANGTMGLPQLLLSPCSASVLFIPMSVLLQAPTVSFFFFSLFKRFQFKIHFLLQQTFKFPISWTFQICLEESQT